MAMAEDFSDTPVSPVIREAIHNSDITGDTEDGEVLSAIPFHQYMTLCLYHPDFGYYRSDTPRVGREGDFYTSAYVGDIMGEQLAAFVARLADERFPDGRPIDVIDWGGGTGRLGRHMLDAWASDEKWRERFTLTVADGNPGHRRSAIETLGDYVREGKARVTGAEAEHILPRDERPAIVVANELLDAFPVRRIVRRGGRLREWGVAWSDKHRRFVPCLIQPADSEPAEWLERERLVLADNQTFEINFAAAEWVSALGRMTDRAALVLIDYGDEQGELSAPHRMDGTLLCYYKHQAHNDPYVLPGLQDLTAHVNFSHIRSAARQAGWEESWYGTQKKFLIDTGVMEKLSAHAIADPFHPVVRRNRAIRQLLLSDGMSELFKVQVFVK